MAIQPGQAGAEIQEIEITPEMIEAGADVLIESGVEGDHAPLPRHYARALAKEVLLAAIPPVKTPNTWLLNAQTNSL